MPPAARRFSEEAWRAKVRGWFPALYDTRLRRPSWDEIAACHERIEELLGVVPASVIHQRLADEQGLQASVASLRRYLRAHFDKAAAPRRGDGLAPAGRSRRGGPSRLRLPRQLVRPRNRQRRVWGFSMVLSYSRHLFCLRMGQSA